MSTISITKLYTLLAAKLGRETSENLTTFIEEKMKSEMESTLPYFATKEDLAKTESRLVKWMFIFWISQVITTFGFILLFLNK